MIYTLYIFDRHCNCLFYTEWNRRQAVRPCFAFLFEPSIERSDHPKCCHLQLSMSQAEDQKLVYGLVFSLKNMCEKLSPSGQPYALDLLNGMKSVEQKRLNYLHAGARVASWHSRPVPTSCTTLKP